jgi:hypothetical protein
MGDVLSRIAAAIGIIGGVAVSMSVANIWGMTLALRNVPSLTDYLTVADVLNGASLLTFAVILMLTVSSIVFFLFVSKPGQYPRVVFEELVAADQLVVTTGTRVIMLFLLLACAAGVFLASYFKFRFGGVFAVSACVAVANLIAVIFAWSQTKPGLIRNVALCCVVYTATLGLCVFAGFERMASPLCETFVISLADGTQVKPERIWVLDRGIGALDLANHASRFIQWATIRDVITNTANCS